MRRCLFSSVLLLVPCFWLPRIQAGDLSSHTYNAWLAQLIARGEAPGLRVEPQWSNTLFDLVLSALWRFGPGAAQRIAVSAAVLIFFWGAFAFIRVAARREPWFLMPILAMLTYGWVFHAGFFNFYLSLGLSFWTLSLLWRRRPGVGRIAAAAAILILAYIAHTLPVLWAGGIVAYLIAARRLRPRYRSMLALGALAAIAGVRVWLDSRFLTVWYPQQIGYITGTDQIFVFGFKFQLLQAWLLGVCGMLLVLLVEQRGWRRLLLSAPLHAAFVTAVLVAVLPSRILLPEFDNTLGYIAERMSLPVAIFFCATVAAVRLRPSGVAWIGILAAVFFGCLYAEQRAICRIEDRLERAIAGLPARARLVSSLAEYSYRVDPLIHLIDRVCIGRCFSYANYEPGSRAFRIRTAGDSPIVVGSYADSYALQSGTYKVKPSDLPLWGVFPVEGKEEFTVRPLEAAESYQVARRMTR